MNGPILTEVFIAVAGFVLSVATSFFIAGTRWGRMESRIDSVDTRLGNIESMFVLTLKQPGSETRS